jgi:hypothetical protein
MPRNKRQHVAPGDCYLGPAGTVEEFPIAPRCSCEAGTAGDWIVEKKDGSLWRFGPSTQIQKDIWLDSRHRAGLPAEEMLRWLCRGCGKVQMP